MPDDIDNDEFRRAIYEQARLTAAHASTTAEHAVASSAHLNEIRKATVFIAWCIGISILIGAVLAFVTSS